MGDLRKVSMLLVMFAVIASPDWTQSQSAGDPIEVFWSYKNTGSFEDTVGPEPPLQGNRSELSYSLPFSKGHRRNGKVDTVVSIFERSELLRMKRSLTSKDDLGRIVFGGSVRIVDGYTWSEDLLFSNTSFYRDLEAQVILMLDNVFGSTSVAPHYAGASVIQFSFGSIVVHFTVSFTMDTDNGTTIADTSLTGPNITRLFLEAASNLSSNYSLDTNDTMLLEILVSTDSSYTTSMWTALLSTDLQLVANSDVTSSVPTNFSVSSHVTPTSSPDSATLSSASELDQSSSRSDHVQESLHSIVDAFRVSSSPAGENSETSSAAIEESDLSVSLSSFSPLASTITPGGKETSYVAIESKETLSLPLQATVTRSYSSSALERYLIQATSILPHNYTTSVLTEESLSSKLGETDFVLSSLSPVAATMPMEYSRGVSTAAGFSQDHFASEVSQKYVLLSSPEDTLAQELQKTPALSASNVFLEATSFDLELMLMPSSSNNLLESTGDISGVVSRASREATLELKPEAMSSMLLQGELSLSSITQSHASTEVLLSTSAVSMVLESASTQELETTVRSVLNVTAVPPTSSFPIEGVSTEESKATWSIHYNTTPSFTDSYVAADFTSFSQSSVASSFSLELNESSSLYVKTIPSTSTSTEVPVVSSSVFPMITSISPVVTSVPPVITSTIGTVIPSSVAPSSTTSSEMPSRVPFVITSITGPIITSSVSPVITSSASLVITSSVVSANTSIEAPVITSSVPLVITSSAVPATISSEISSSVPLVITSSAAPTTASSVMTSIASPVNTSSIFPESTTSASPKTSSAVGTSTSSELSPSVPLIITSSEVSAMTTSSVPAITSSAAPGSTSDVPLGVSASIVSASRSSVPSLVTSSVPLDMSSTDSIIPSGAGLEITSSSVPATTLREILSSVPSVITARADHAITSSVPAFTSKEISSVPFIITSSAVPIIISSVAPTAITSGEMSSSVPSVIASIAGPEITSSIPPVFTSSIPSVIISSLDQVIISSLDHVISSSSIPAKTSSEISSGVPLVIISSAFPTSTSSIVATSTSSGISPTTSTEISSKPLVMTSAVAPIITSSVPPLITSSVEQAFTSSGAHSIPSSAPPAYSPSDISSSLPFVITSSALPASTSTVLSVITSSVPLVSMPSANSLILSSAGSVITSSAVLATSSVAISSAGLLETSRAGTAATSVESNITTASRVLEVISSTGSVDISSAGFATSSGMSLEVTTSAMFLTTSSLFPIVTSSVLPVTSLNEGFLGGSTDPLIPSSAGSVIISSAVLVGTSSVIPVNTFTAGFEAPPSLVLVGTASSVPMTISSTVPVITQRDDSVAISSIDTGVTSSTGPTISAVPIETSAAVPVVITSVLSVASSAASVAASSAVPVITSSSVLTGTFSGVTVATLSSADMAASSAIPKATSGAVPITTLSEDHTATSGAVPTPTSTTDSIVTSSLATEAASSSSPVSLSSAVPLASSAIGTIAISSAGTVATSSAVPITSSAVPITSSAVPITSSLGFVTSSASPVTTLSVPFEATSSLGIVATSGFAHLVTSSIGSVAASSIASAIAPSAVPVATSSAVPVATSSAVPVATSSAGSVATLIEDLVETSSKLKFTSSIGLETSPSDREVISSLVIETESRLDFIATTSLSIKLLSSQSAEATTKLSAASIAASVATKLLSEVTPSLQPGTVVTTSLAMSLATDSAVMWSRESEASLTPSFAATSSVSLTGTVSSSLSFPDTSILSTGSTSTTFSSFSFASTAAPSLNASIGTLSSSITSTAAISPSPSAEVTSSRRLEEGFLSMATYLSTSSSSEIVPSLKASSFNIVDTPTVATSSSILRSDSGLASSWVTEVPSVEQERLTSQTESPLTSKLTPSLEQQLFSSLIDSMSIPFSPSASSPSQSRMIMSSSSSFDLVKLLEGSSTTLDLSSLSSVQSTSFSSTQATSFISTGVVPEASLSSVVVKSTWTAAEVDTVLYSSLRITSSVPYSSTKETLSDTISQSSLRGTDLSTSALYSSTMATSSDTSLYSSIFRRLSDTASYSRIIATSSDTYLYSSTEGVKSSESVLYSSSKESPSSNMVLYPSTLKETSLSDTVLYSSIVGTLTETVLYSKSLSLSSFSLMNTTVDGGSDIPTTKVFLGTSGDAMTTSSLWIGASSSSSTWSVMLPSAMSSDARSSTSSIFQGTASSFAETTDLVATTTRVPVEGSSVPPSQSSAIFRTTDEMTYAPTSDITTTTPPKTSSTTITTVTTTTKSSQESSSGSQVLEPSTFFSTTTTTSSTPTTAPAENDGATKTFQGNMRVVNGASFSEDLLDKNSDAYKQMEAEIKAFIMQVLEQCGLSQRVGSIQITGFRSGSVIVIFTVDIVYETATDLTATFLEGYLSLNQTDYVLDDSYTEVKELQGNQSSGSPQIDLSSSSLSPSSEFLQSVDTRGTPVMALQSTLFTSSVAAPDCSCDMFSVQQNCTHESCTDKCNYSSSQDLPCSSVVTATATSVTLPESYFIKKSSSMFSVYNTASTTPGSTGDPCVNNPCPVHSQCQGVGYSYTCTCDPGYSRQSDRCVDIDECLSNPCPENGVCTNTAGGFFCFCRSGFIERGDRCEDVNECASGLCPLHSNCTNTIGSFFCNCWSGFQLSNGLCINVDECSSSPCSLKATCIDNVGSFSCECLQGYMMENNSCSDIDECFSPDTCHVHARCHNTDGGYNCTCSPGYEDIGGVCTDVNECRQNPCPPFSVCENFPGSFDCQCAQGFYNQSGQCKDINECLDPIAYPCQQHAACENLQGSYLCTCLKGFVPQGGACQDVNECIMSSVCPALSECRNTEGNYSCVCQRELFQIDPYTCTEAKTFELIFPSILEADNLTLQVTAELRHNLSSQFLGITLSSGNRRLFLRLSTNYSGGTLVLKNALSLLFDQISYNYTLFNQTSLDLVDVDECREANWTDCSTNGSSCKNDVGGYTCECSLGFVDYSDSKRPGRLCLAIDNNHQQSIKGLAVTVKSMSQISSSNSKFQIGDKVVFTLSVTEGSHVKFRIQFGDGGGDSLVHPNIISYMSPASLNYTYERTGVWTAIVNASNAVSYMMASADVKIIEPVKNLILNTTEISQSPVSTFLFTVTLNAPNYTLEDVACKFDFGDGQSETRSQDTLTQRKSISTTHGYSLGIFDITVLCSNNISAQSLNTTAKAEEIIGGLKVSISTLYVRVGDLIHITVETVAGSNIVLRADLGDGRQEMYTVGNNRRGSSVTQLQVKYSQVGRYSLSLLAENLLSRATISVADRIRVLNVVKDLVLVAPGPVAYPPGIANLALVYSLTSSPPSEVSCEVIAEYVLPSIYTASEISVGNNLTLPLFFTNASAVGVNSVTVNCSNPLSYQVLQADVLVQAVVKEVAVVVNQTYIMVKGAVDVNISVGFGSHAQYFLDFGDGSNFSGVFVPTLVERKVLTIRHAFDSAGLYTITLSVFNRVSSSMARAMVGALEEVTDVSLSAWYQPLDNNDTLRGGHGSASDVFPLEREVILVAALGSGNDITYTWMLGGGPPVSTRDKVLRYTFRNVGRYQVSVNASNALFYGTASIAVTIYQTVLMHTLTNNGPTDAYRTIRFTLTLARLGTDTCFLWNMGDGSEDYVFGERYCANYTKTSVDKFSKIPSSLQVIQDHMYHTNNTFYVKVLAKNLVSEGVINNIAVISGVSCHYPQVHIAGGGQQIDKPVTHLKSQWISIESTVDINCQVTQQADYFWKTERVLTGNNFLDFKFEVVSVDSISAGLFKILYTAGAFELGTYRISLNVSMRGIPGLFQSHFTYLLINPTPLVAYIRGGASRTVGYDKVFFLDALSDSYDPDQRDLKDKTGLTFQWYCQRAGEALPDNPSVIVIPTNVSQVDFRGQGGCFGTGPGKLPGGLSGYLQVNSFFLQFKSVNLFTVEVRKDNRVSTYVQAMTVVDGDPPQLNIECVINCNSKVNPSGEFTLLVRCIQCRPTDKITFQWSLFLESKDSALTSVAIPDNATSTGLSSPGISFKPSYLKGGLTYRLRLDGVRDGYVPGYTEYVFVTNLPPYGGKCWIFPQEGFALDTLFVINCSGWLNPGEESSSGRGLIYRFWISPPGQSNQLLYYGTDPFTPESKLPLGLEDRNFRYDVTVRIANPIGEYIQQVITVKVTRPTVMKSVDSLLNLTLGGTSRLSMFLATGREQEAKQMIVALASLLNTAVVTNSATTTTAATTRSPTTATTQAAAYVTQRALNITGTFSFPATNPTSLSSTTATTSAGVVTTTVTAGGSMPPSTTAQTSTERSPEEKQKLTELRTEVVKSLAKTTALTLDSLQQTARAVKVITDQTDEISEECQRLTVGTMADITVSFSSMVAEERTQSIEQEMNTAGDIVATLGNVLLAATKGIKVEDIVILSWKDASTDGVASVSTLPTNITTWSTSPDASSRGPSSAVSLLASSSVAASTSTTEQPVLNKREQVRMLTQQTMALADVVAKTVLQRQVPGAPPVVLSSRLFTVTVARNSLSTFNNSVHTSQQGSFVFPSSENFPVDNATSFLDTQFVTSNKNPYIWDASAKEVTSPVLSMTVYDELGTKINVSDLSQPIKIEISTGATGTVPVSVSPFLTGDADLYYHVIDPQWNVTGALSIDLKPLDRHVTLEAFFKWGSSPTATDYDFYRKVTTKEIDKNSPSLVFIRSEDVEHNFTNLLYMGIRKYVNVSLEEPDYTDYYVDLDTVGARNESLPPYSVTFFTSSCRFWNEKQETWSTDGCEVSAKSTADVTQCLCSHLTSFASGVFVAPNAIHFDTVFVSLDNKIADNFSVLVTLCLTFGIYFVGLVWARRMDRKDVEKWGATPLADNVMTDKYFYKLTVFTGMRRGGGTRSRVSFILAGDYSDTGVRQLVDETGKKTLSRGSINQYILGVPETLGSLMYLRLWHDNSGKGRHQGWYLSKVIITDLQNGTSYIFLCNRWLAVEEDDGKVDRMLPVAGREDLIDFNHLFFTETRRSLSDNHLWLSVFSRPRRSSFSRVQRLSCILCLLLATMMADAMFYQAGGDPDTASGALEIGPIKITLQELYVSFVSSLIILPLNVIIDQLFRRSRPRDRKTAAAVVIEGQLSGPPASGSKTTARPDVSSLFRVPANQQEFSSTPFPENEQGNSTITNVDAPQEEDCHCAQAQQEDIKDGMMNQSQKNNPNVKVPSKSSKFMLPHTCVYVAWMLVAAVSGVSAFIIFSYSMEWGRDKSIAWLLAMFLSVGQSVTLIQPVKILLQALLIAWACKSPTDRDTDIEIEEVLDASQVHLMPEEIMEYMPKMARRPHLSVPPPDPEVLNTCRERRLKELAMQRVTVEIFAYLTYLFLLTVIARNNSDIYRFLWTNNIQSFLNSGPTAVEEVRQAEDFWTWTQMAMVPFLYAETDFHGQPLAYGNGLIVSSLDAYRVGPVRLRQHRVTKDSCLVSQPFSPSEISCTKSWSWESEDTAAYSVGWKTLGQDFKEEMNSPWTHRDWTETDGIPYVGDISAYPAGGYIKDLIGKKERVAGFLNEMQSFQWLDKYTRSVFVEFILYNPNVNLFAFVTVVFETPVTESLQGKIIVSPFRLYSDTGGYGVVVIICETLAIVWTIYFLQREGKKVWQERSVYLRKFWNWIELGTLLGSVTAIVMYAGRYLLTLAAMKKVKSLKGKYYNFQRLALWNELFSYVLAFVTFLAVLKTLHLLRFNRRLSMLGTTLLRAAKDLFSFSIVFSLVVVAFTAFAFLLFCSLIPDYSTFLKSFETLLAVSLGQSQFQILQEANFVIGPVFCFLYIFFVFFVLLNMFVTILSETFSAVRQDLTQQSNDYEILEFMWSRFWEWVGTTPFKLSGGSKDSYISRDHKADASVRHPRDSFDDLNKGPFTTMSVLNLMLRHLETDFDGLNDGSPHSASSVLKIVPGYSSLYADDNFSLYDPMEVTTDDEKKEA